MTSPYPVPHYAATIWLAGNDIMLGFEQTAEAKGFSIRIPANEKGLAIAMQILRDREKLATPATTGTRAEPTQHILDAWMREYRKKVELPKDVGEALKELEP